jgi:hypothetical protein
MSPVELFGKIEAPDAETVMFDHCIPLAKIIANLKEFEAWMSELQTKYSPAKWTYSSQKIRNYQAISVVIKNVGEI